MTKQVLCLMGLTGAGKTALAMKLYDALDAEIISVDSAMIYQGMDIGTAKPEAALLEKYPHHLVDICHPSANYSAAQFVTDASQLIDDCHTSNKLPILVGGTMLYFKAIQQGLNQLPESDLAIRQKFEALKQQHGLNFLYQQLQTYDPATAARLSANDPQRIQRALEIFETTGKPMSELLAQSTQGADYDFINIGLIPEDRAWLHKKLAYRFELMIEQGFQAEVERLMEMDINADLPAMRCVGYKQMLAYLNGEMTYDEMKQKAVATTRQLAKRQHTWLRKWPQLHVFEPLEPDLFTLVMNALN